MNLKTIKSAYRRSWAVKPVQRADRNRKTYRRSDAKREARGLRSQA